jgi:hypothetical protein
VSGENLLSVERVVRAHDIYTFSAARRSFFQAHHALFLDERRALGEARRPLTYWSHTFMNARRPLLVTKSKIVIPLAKIVT